MSAELKSREKTLSSTYDIKLLERSMQYAEHNLAKENPVFSIYLNSNIFTGKK